MDHNQIAAEFRDILEQKNIEITTDPWDKIIYNFAKNNKHLNYNKLVKNIHKLIEITIK